MIAIFVYNILLIILYSITMTFAIYAYLKEKNNLFLWISLYLAFFIFDNTIIYMTEFLNSFAQSYDQAFMSAPAVKTIIFMGNAFFSISILAELQKEKLSPLHYALLLALAVWMITIPLMDNSAFKVWLYYLGNQLFLFYLGIYCWRGTKKDVPLLNKHYLKQLMFINLFFSILIIIEDSFVIFNVDQYSSLVTKIYNRSVSEDIFSIVICVLLLHFFIKKYQPQKEKTQNQDTSLLIQDFCQVHQFTQRETEIFVLLLSHRTNQEIADQLFLSLGTVKTHVHNIFIKLDIKKRTQIIPLFEKYKEAIESTV
ncbi:response regulator transcription factor [Enterococcus hirae]|uniref:response regulator transcription factor n=1 Tax=Enterococcus hirae TaxID=1354 RepID=UPI002542CEA3|nr:helix-turn-helix transcriptional regulator [Enterococcus hirae]EMF0035401.1 helix-turn-helix transcriptional regulator [Enterococcus hirae]EMF0047697.1 helix-turn-helix transcriptional regulator [Enterococcus hirae]EMF0086298.1 helix-turn-helix transcriptional regulator [Enterococcus hirae]EMF0159555.1 helix-turn-helix transcriptional regulator [Enterococcus hirae]EMF0211066.1 helix-turn-helix transcriptional regulator [Enterococcus hirae]